jgi:uncharacterized protein YaaQ
MVEYKFHPHPTPRVILRGGRRAAIPAIGGPAGLTPPRAKVIVIAKAMAPMTASKPVDRVAVITLQGGAADALTRRLNESGFQVTIIESRGGFILEPSSTLLIGFCSADQDALLEHTRELCAAHKRLIPVQPDGSLLPALPLMIEAEVGGASVIAFPVEQFIKL